MLKLFILGGCTIELKSKKGDGRLFKMGLFLRGYGTSKKPIDN